MAKIVKNTTISDIELPDTGTTIPASGQLTLDPIEYYLYAASTDIIPHIDSGDIVINDGTADLPITEAKVYIKMDCSEGECPDHRMVGVVYAAGTTDIVSVEYLATDNFDFLK